jgi:hypothetical protein
VFVPLFASAMSENLDSTSVPTPPSRSLRLARQTSAIATLFPGVAYALALALDALRVGAKVGWGARPFLYVEISHALVVLGYLAFAIGFTGRLRRSRPDRVLATCNYAAHLLAAVFWLYLLTWIVRLTAP